MRIRSLDGLRGLAAFLVLVHHTFECLGPLVPTNLAQVFLTLGQQCVWLFFVLSGLVLARLSESANFDSAKYLVARMARLYIPTISAAVLAYLSMLAISRKSLTGNPWIDNHPHSISLSAVASDFTLVNSTSGNLMPLWSLKWEVLYSAFLLVFVFVAKRVDWRIAIPLALVLGSAGIGELVFYSSMFLLGTFLGLNQERLLWFLKQHRWLPSWLFLTGISLVALSNYLLGWFHFSLSGNLGIIFSLVGITALVATAELSFAGQFLRSRLVQFLGTISFSLYLVHEPVLIAMARIGRLNPWVTLAGVPFAIGFAYCFYFLLERNAHTLSRNLSH